jgi:hypothetical protein
VSSREPFPKRLVSSTPISTWLTRLKKEVPFALARPRHSGYKRCCKILPRHFSDFKKPPLNLAIPSPLCRMELKNKRIAPENRPLDKFPWQAGNSPERP